MITRPVLRYHGGKWLLAPWIIGHFPAHRVYVEPFGGVASVLLRKPRSYAEVYNDLDGEIVNLFRVLRDPTQARELVRIVRLTPYARAEFELSYITDGDPIEQARRTMFRSFAGFSSSGATGKWSTGFRGNVTRSGTTPAADWRNFPDCIEAMTERLRGVVIESCPAADVIERYDGERALFYLDPPYPASERNSRWCSAAYRYEMTDDEHRELAALVRTLKGMVIISGYACDLYDLELYARWQRITRDTHADSALDRTEVLWISPNATQQQIRLPLQFQC